MLTMCVPVFSKHTDMLQLSSVNVPICKNNSIFWPLVIYKKKMKESGNKLNLYFVETGNGVFPYMPHCGIVYSADRDVTFSCHAIIRIRVLTATYGTVNLWRHLWTTESSSVVAIVRIRGQSALQGRAPVKATCVEPPHRKWRPLSFDKWTENLIINTDRTLYN